MTEDKLLQIIFFENLFILMYALLVFDYQKRHKNRSEYDIKHNKQDNNRTHLD